MVDMNNKMTDCFLTPAQAAERLQVSPRTVKRLCESGRIQAADIGTGKNRVWRIPVESLAAILPRGPILRKKEPQTTYRPRPMKYLYA